MTKLKLYPTVKVEGMSFKGHKKWTVPNQSLSLAEIIRRFVRRQPLPTSEEGVYETRFGDLEKMKHKDPVEQLEWAADLRDKISAFNERQKADYEKAKQEALLAEAKLDAAAEPATTPKKPKSTGTGVSKQSMAKSASPARGLDEVH